MKTLTLTDAALAALSIVLDINDDDDDLADAGVDTGALAEVRAAVRSAL